MMSSGGGALNFKGNVMPISGPIYTSIEAKYSLKLKNIVVPRAEFGPKIF